MTKPTIDMERLDKIRTGLKFMVCRDDDVYRLKRAFDQLLKLLADTFEPDYAKQIIPPRHTEDQT